MSPDDRRLLALVAVFAPTRAEPLLSRLGSHGAEPIRAEGVRLSSAPRQARLLELAGVLARSPSPSEPSVAIAAAERPLIAARLDPALAPGRGVDADDALRPALRRLLGERLQPTAG